MVLNPAQALEAVLGCVRNAFKQASAELHCGIVEVTDVLDDVLA